MGYAWVPVALAAHGTRVSVTSPGGAMSAEVVPLPFWDPHKEVPKG
jgi:glycine cleavage system aminomethyltransferase T